MFWWLLACAPTRDCGALVYWVEPAADVRVIGDWNGWNPDADPLVKGDDGVWRTTVDLPAGDYAYLFVVDGVEARDPFAPLIDWDPTTDTERSKLRVEDCTQPTLRVDAVTVSADGQLAVDATFLRAEAPLRSAEASYGEALTTTTGLMGEVHVEGILPAGKSTVVIEASDGEHTASVRLPLWVEAEPFTWEDAVIYQVILDRFASADGALPQDYAPGAIASRMGGTFTGVRRAVEGGYFSDLGVNTLWLSPVQANAAGEWPGADGHDYTGYHGYWPVSPDAIEPAFGGEAELDALVAAAHAAGLRVLLDVVPNHVHEEHPYHANDGWFHDDACVCGAADCSWSTEIETCWFTDYLPDLAWENPEVAATVVADTVALVEAHDLDGVRVDAVPMLRRHAVRELVWGLGQALEAGPTDFYTLGETYTGLDGQADIKMNLGPYGLDGQFDFPVLWALRDYAAGGDAEVLAEVIDAGEAAWDGSGSVMAPLLGNHDTTRFVSELAGDGGRDPWTDPPPQPTDAAPYEKLRLAQLIQLTLPGAPVIYQGDEVGLAGVDDPDSRRPMPPEAALSGDQLAVRAELAAITRARSCLVSLRRGARSTLVTDGPVYAHLRDAGDGQPALVVTNASDSAHDVSLPLDESWVDVLTGATGAPTVTLPAWSGRLFIPAASGCAGAL